VANEAADEAAGEAATGAMDALQALAGAPAGARLLDGLAARFGGAASVLRRRAGAVALESVAGRPASATLAPDAGVRLAGSPGAASALRAGAAGPVIGALGVAAELAAPDRAALDAVARRLGALLAEGAAPEAGVARTLPLLDVRVQPLRSPGELDPADPEWRARVRAGMASLGLSAEVVDAAAANFDRWWRTPAFAGDRPQLAAAVERGDWALLLDSFYRVIPFGTGGRRGPVGLGTNRFHPFTLASSVQGHVDYLRAAAPGEALSTVVVWDVRAYHDLRGTYDPAVPNPLMGLSSRDFARIAAGVYAANGVRVHMPPPDTPHASPQYVATPELSFAIRKLGASAGLNISASHNHPDDNGGKFYNRHGGQEIPPDDERMARHVEEADYLLSLDFERAVETGLVEWLDDAVHADYVQLNRAQGLGVDSPGATRIVFTPLHGTADRTVGEVLRAEGYDVVSVPEESTPDGAFPAVPYRAPNPEVPESMRRAEALAVEVGAELALACDPDADRIGCSARGPDGRMHFLKGDEIAVLVTHAKLERLAELGRLPERPLVIKTEVTTGLLRPITEHFGGRLVGDLLVGFKYHGAVLEEIERTGAFRGEPASLADFVVAVEESHGVLVTPEIRDKDAAGGAVVLAELAARLRAEGRTVVEYLDDVYRRFGYSATGLRSTVMTGAEGVEAIERIQRGLRAEPPAELGGLAVERVTDHWDEDGVFGPIRSETDRSSRNVLVFSLAEGARIILRPSGTEPKNKSYVEVPTPPLGEGASDAELAAVRERADARAVAIADDLALYMLGLIGVELPRFALRISGLVDFAKRVDFVESFLPAFEARAAEGGGAALSAWIDERLAAYGKDAKGLVADALREYVDGELAAPGLDAGRRSALETMRRAFE